MYISHPPLHWPQTCFVGFEFDHFTEIFASLVIFFRKVCLFYPEPDMRPHFPLISFCPVLLSCQNPLILFLVVDCILMETLQSQHALQ